VDNSLAVRDDAFDKQNSGRVSSVSKAAAALDIPRHIKLVQKNSHEYAREVWGIRKEVKPQGGGAFRLKAALGRVALSHSERLRAECTMIYMINPIIVAHSYIIN
jgi:hypothetical protein